MGIFERFSISPPWIHHAPSYHVNPCLKLLRNTSWLVSYTPLVGASPVGRLMCLLDASRLAPEDQQQEWKIWKDVTKHKHKEWSCLLFWLRLSSMKCLEYSYRCWFQRVVICFIGVKWCKLKGICFKRIQKGLNHRVVESMEVVLLCK